MKALFTVLVVLASCLALASLSYALPDSLYGTWHIEGDALETYWQRTDYVSNDIDFAFDVEFGSSVSPADAQGLDGEGTTYIPLDSYDDLFVMVDDIASGGPADGTVYYVYLPEEMSNPNEWPGFTIENEYIPGLGVLDAVFGNYSERIRLDAELDVNLGGNGVPEYKFSGWVDKPQNDDGGFDFSFFFRDNTMDYVNRIYSYQLTVSGEMVLTSPAPIVPETEPAPEPDNPTDNDPPAYTPPVWIPVPVDSGR